MLRIQSFKPADAAALCSWPQNETEFYYWSAGKLGNYPAQPAAVLRFYGEPANRFCGLFAAYDANGLCGHFTLRYTDETQAALRLGFIIINPACRGKGYGKEMLRLALPYAKQHFPGLPVTLGVFAANIPAIRCYQAMGFQYTGEEETLPLPNGQAWVYRIMQYQPSL